MKMIRLFTLLVVVLVFLNACSDDKDTEKPSIDLSVTDAFPANCDTLYFDQPFTVKLLLRDNVELGAYNIDIHQNFDQHTHSTEIEQCNLDKVKTAKNPYIFIEDYTIPAASSTYTIDASMTLPASDGMSKYDEGDYHFQVKVTDKEGWSTLMGLNVKILHR